MFSNQGTIRGALDGKNAWKQTTRMDLVQKALGGLPMTVVFATAAKVCFWVFFFNFFGFFFAPLSDRLTCIPSFPLSPSKTIGGQRPAQKARTRHVGPVRVEAVLFFFFGVREREKKFWGERVFSTRKRRKSQIIFPRKQKQNQKTSPPPDASLTTYVGDAAGRLGDFADSDKGFAEAAGLNFRTPEEFFGGPTDVSEFDSGWKGIVGNVEGDDDDDNDEDGNGDGAGPSNGGVKSETRGASGEKKKAKKESSPNAAILAFFSKLVDAYKVRRKVWSFFC